MKGNACFVLKASGFCFGSASPPAWMSSTIIWQQKGLPSSFPSHWSPEIKLPKRMMVEVAADLLLSCLGASCALAVKHHESSMRCAQRYGSVTNLTDYTQARAWRLDGKHRLAGSKVFGQRAQKQTHVCRWKLGCQNLRAQAKAGPRVVARGWVGSLSCGTP